MISETHERAEVVIHGRVQGVGFRAWTRDTARDLDLGGQVRNAPDGTVHASFVGSTEAVEKMLGFCATGPAASDVQEVELRSREPANVEKSRAFNILR